MTSKNIYKNWQTKKLGDLCRIELGKTPYRGNHFFWDIEKQTNNVWLSIADLLNVKGNVISDSKEYISDQGADLSKIVKKGTLLVSFKLTLGRLAFAGRDLYTNEAIAALEIKNEKELLKDYLYHYLKFFDWNAATQGDVKVKGKTLNKSKLKEIFVSFPESIEEQKRIVKILNEAFQGIEKTRENTEKNLQNSRELFDSYLNDIFFSQNINWNEFKFGEIIHIKHGFAFKSKFFTTQGEYVLLTPGNFFEKGGYRDRKEKQKYYSGPIPDGFVLKKGDLLVAMTEQAPGLLGSPVIIPGSKKFLHNQRLGLVSFLGNLDLDTSFIFYLFNTQRVRSEIHKGSTGVKVRHTSPEKISKIRVWIPEIELQRDIVKKLDTFSGQTRDLERIYRQKIINLEELKKSILAKAFVGEL